MIEPAGPHPLALFSSATTGVGVDPSVETRRDPLIGDTSATKPPFYRFCRPGICIFPSLSGFLDQLIEQNWRCSSPLLLWTLGFRDFVDRRSWGFERSRNTKVAAPSVHKTPQNP